MEKLQRRDWLKQSTLLLAGMGIPATFFGSEKQVPGWDDTREAKPFVKLSSNENPYGPSPMARKAMAAAISGSNRYQWQTIEALRKKVGEVYGLDENHVLMGAGSSEILGNVSAFCGKIKGNAVSPHPTFRLWWQVAESFGLSIKKVPLTADKQINTSTLLSAIDGETRMLYICNPNNPTGTVIPADELKRCIEIASQKVMVLLDEAYTEYCDEPGMAPLVATNKNLVIAKTFSKIYGMAGARAGFALAHPDTIKQLAAFQPWANAGVSAVSLAGAMASLDDQAFVKECRAKNDQVKKYATQALEQLKMPVIKSHTNFLYYQAAGFTGDFAKAINSSTINAVRIFEEEGQWYRTSIGTMEEMKIFIDTVKGKIKG